MGTGKNSERVCHVLSYEKTKSSENRTVVSGYQTLEADRPGHPLSVSQSTAVECHDKLVAAGAIPLNKDISSDATNSCAFLSVLITDLFVGQSGNVTLPALDTAKWSVLVKQIDEIVLTMPNRFNLFRNIERMYDVSEAYAILRKENILSREFEFTEELVSPHHVFSKKGRDALLRAVNTLCAASKPNNVTSYSCGGYVFVLGCKIQPIVFGRHTSHFSATGRYGKWTYQSLPRPGL